MYHVNNGIWAKDTITFDKSTTLISTSSSHADDAHPTAAVRKTKSVLSFTGLFGCAEAYKTCTPDSPADCLNATSECPVGPTPSNLFEGGCPGSNNGKEAGWTFNFGGPASAMAVPEQVFNAGLINNKVVSERRIKMNWQPCWTEQSSTSHLQKWLAQWQSVCLL